MKLTPNIQKAINLAANKHASQRRKVNGNPYIIHPFSVAWILSNYTHNEDTIIAALLHDTLEDVKQFYYEDIKQEFGEEVAKLVKEVSKDNDPNIESDKRTTWTNRKKGYLEHLRIASKKAMMICAADKIHNLQSTAEDFKKHGNKIWDSFDAPIERKIGFYKEIIKVLKERLNNPIVVELETTFKNTMDKIKIKPEDIKDFT